MGNFTENTHRPTLTTDNGLIPALEISSWNTIKIFKENINNVYMIFGYIKQWCRKNVSLAAIFLHFTTSSDDNRLFHGDMFTNIYLD